MLASPRRRRRLLWLSTLAGVAASVALLVVFVRDTARTVDAPLRDEPASTYQPPPTAPLSREAVDAARLTAIAFIRTAVMRRNLDASWKLVHPSLRRGFTPREWRTGNIPVIPYPADLERLRYQVEYSHDDLLGISVALVPTAGSKVDPTVFRIELTRAGEGPRSHWLVSSWGPVGVPLEILQQRLIERRGPINPPSNSLSALWLTVPVLLLLGVLMVPGGLALRSWRRGRRAARAYEAARSRSDR